MSWNFLRLGGRCSVRLTPWVFFLAGLQLLAAQGRTPVLVRGEPVGFSVPTAPESLVWRVFFSILVAQQKAAERSAPQDKDAQAVGRQHQKITGLSDADYQKLKDVASKVVADLESSRERSDRALKSARAANGSRSMEEEYRQFRGGEDSNAVGNGVQQLRQYLGTEKFGQLDQRVRRQIVPNLTIRRVVIDTEPRAAQGGNQ